ncbi:unnamed protein product (macronuclear) [Paramecium tetraurelia]|uniref:Transmembrane protein n=1 Tax=Paramecium tetraurelia TaxID=5888 RepID=A0CE09_PARTE|nr:uncharacterized protein GSPATT00007238001 [Paramecium tetraurelia]CAK69026.1 unnamed protein product [Paramecium tetraurelia]|eukprot:XP_001436423.1 hypothetical protein (macronuclear) [Paramecium tetraurelia strain d4-2]
MLKFQKKSKHEAKTCVLDIVNSLDFFGQPPFFRILKRQKFNTLLGHFLTIILLIMCALYLYFQFQDLLDQRTPNIIISETQPFNTPAFPLYSENFTFAISITGPTLSSLTTYKKHFDIAMTACNRTRFYNETTQATDISLICRNIPLEGCNLEDHFPKEYQKQFFGKFRLTNMFCINKKLGEENPPQLQGYTSADTYQYVNISMSPCKNTSTYDGCSPVEEIQAGLKTGFFALYLGDTLLKLDNPGRPYEEIITVQFAAFSSSLSKQIYSTFKMIETKTDVGLIQQDLVTELGLMQSSIKDSSGPFNQNSYVENILFMDQRANNYKRSYIKVQNILGNVGGLWQLVALTITTLVSPIIATLMNMQMANRIFNFENGGDKVREVHSVSNSNQNINININGKPEQKDLIVELNKQGRIPQSSKRDLEKVQNRGQLKQYLKQRKRQLKVGLWDLMCMNIGLKRRQKQQIDYAIEKILCKLDVVNILTKIQEIDKLKYVILNKDQLELFNYIPKPLIPMDMFSQDFEKKLNVLEEKAEFQFILQEEKSDLIKVEQAFNAYMKLQEKKRLTDTDKSILELVGDDMIAIFDKINKNQDEFLLQSNRYIHSNLNLLEQNQIEIISPISSKSDNDQFNRSVNNFECIGNEDNEDQVAQIPPKIPSKK